MPRIIQLCDGIMAGGQPAQTHGICIFNIYTLSDLGVSNNKGGFRILSFATIVLGHERLLPSEETRKWVLRDTLWHVH